MPTPQAHPQWPRIRNVATNAIIFGVAITIFKFAIFFYTNSVAVLSDALESIVNIVAAVMMLFTVRLANMPADENHPYGHGKVEFLAVGCEALLIFTAGVIIAYEAIDRLRFPLPLEDKQLALGLWLLALVAVISAGLAYYIYSAGKRYDSVTLVADGRHIFTDVASTIGIIVGLYLAKTTGWAWLDPVVAMIMATFILITSWKLMRQSIHGLMDRQDPEDVRTISQILDDEIAKGSIYSYHHLRHRHSGAFHWVDVHLQIDSQLTIEQGHTLGSRIEYRIEQTLGQGNATAHLEPHHADSPVEPIPTTVTNTKNSI